MNLQRYDMDMALMVTVILLGLLASTGAVPSLSLKDCPTDFAPDSSSCTCIAENVTSSFSGLLWKDPLKNSVVYGEESQTSVTLPFIRIERKFNGQTYTCELVDSVHKKDIAYNPKVAERPSEPVLKNCPTDYIMPKDKSANCTCMTTNPGVPAALIVWIDPDQNAVMYTDSGLSLTLSFTAMKANYSQRAYHCVLRHVTGDLSVAYTPLLVVKPESPEIEDLKDWYAEGESIRLKCAVKGGVPGVQKVLFYCTNHRDRPDNIENSHLTSSLDFEATKSDNNTQCYCYGTNEYFISTMYSFNLRVGDAGASARPMISLQNCPMYFLPGTSRCSCVAENLGTSNVTLLWTDPDGQTVMYGSTSRLTLTLPNQRFNKRQYRCDLLHSSGAQSISYTLNIAEPPSEPYLEKCPTNKAEANQVNASCTCKTSNIGVPSALFVWDDPDGHPVNYTRTGTSLGLSFAAVNESYFGKPYRCILRHITGDQTIDYISLKGGPRTSSSQSTPSASFFSMCTMVFVVFFQY